MDVVEKYKQYLIGNSIFCNNNFNLQIASFINALVIILLSLFVKEANYIFDHSFLSWHISYFVFRRLLPEYCLTSEQGDRTT